VLELLRSEIDRVMAMCGWDRLADLDRSALFTPPVRAQLAPIAAETASGSVLPAARIAMPESYSPDG
jgi:hypothetical protein